MGTRGKLMIAAAAAGVLSAPAFAQQSGPVATYWVSASTTTGMGGMMGALGSMSGQGGDPSQQQPKQKRPGLGAMLGAAASGMVPGAGLFGGRGGDSNGGNGGGSGRGGGSDYAAMAQGGGPAVRTLSLQLGSLDKPSGDPTAEHLIPTGLNMGPSLPLVTPQSAPPTKSEEGEYQMPQQMQQPKGKMLIYWGCGEHAAAPPIVLDFATMSQGQMPNMPMLAVKSEHPPSANRSTTYGSWPNQKDSQRVPNDGSLVGDHMVRGDYTPDIHFSLGPDHDFMGALTITGQEPTDGGGLRLTWNSVQGATGYYAWMMGFDPKGGGSDGRTMVMWTSGMKASSFSALLDYLPPAEVRRLVAQQVVMAPDATECIVPSEVREREPDGHAVDDRLRRRGELRQPAASDQSQGALGPEVRGQGPLQVHHLADDGHAQHGRPLGSTPDM